MVGWLKALLFVVGGVTAAAGTAYVTGLLDPLFTKQPEVIASVPPQQTGETEPPASAEAPASSDEEEPAAAEKQDRLVMPTFDVLRVEPDGSVLIAGKVAPDATVEVLNGDDVVTSAKATPEGDFVAILEERLDAGDYRLALRSISDDIVTLSQETAIVSIPEKSDGQVLAMVEAPGAPAELVTVPEPAAEEPAAAAPVSVPAAGDEAVEQDQDEAAPEEPAIAGGEQEAKEPAQQETAGTSAQPETEAAAAAAPEADEAPAAAEPGQQETGVAAAPATDQPEVGAEQPAATTTVVVEAVEIEGDTIFVAGRSLPGGTVRVYADDALIGDAQVSEGGRFLVEARRDLPVGHYTIRADLLGADGAVLARAAVPFEREQGDSIAAVAPPAASESAAPQGGAAPAAAEPEAEAASAEAAQEGVTAPALQRVDGSVIIRRGDSLWRISRRVYGKGVRYSTIYLANQDQITDPDRIWPGQVFTVPQETSEGEQADMDAIGEQAVTPEDGSAAQ